MHRRLFLIEGCAAVIVSFSFFFMPRDIDALKSLDDSERDALHACMHHQHKAVASVRTMFVGAVKNPAVWAAGGIKFMRDIGFYGARVELLS